MSNAVLENIKDEFSIEIYFKNLNKFSPYINYKELSILNGPISKSSEIQIENIILNY